jgi:AbrB family looped-hinge helix DNA binding protein
MTGKTSSNAVVRPKRQVTIPKKLCDELGIEPGDTLVFSVENRVLIARTRKTVALEALREIRRAFKESGISEEELQEEGHRMRQEIVRERYGARK